jgi:hypothetical protein
VPACLAAAREAPNDARIVYQLGRALQADKKYENAKTAYQLADSLGHAAAATALGEMLERGEGGSRDLAAAEGLYARAAQAGDRTGADHLQRLRNGLTGTWNSLCCSGKYRVSLELKQTGNQLTGTFGHGVTVTGTRSGNTVQFVGSDGLKFALTVSADGKQLVGTLDGPRDMSVGNEIVMTRWNPPPSSAQGGAASGDILGTQWVVNDSGWSGTWTRRGTSNLFDAVWTLGNDRVEAELAVTLQGNHVEIRRTDTKSNDLGTGIYSGDWNGTHWSGTQVWTSKQGRQFGPFAWSAIPRGVGVQSDTTPADRLGSQWLTVEGGWSGIWTRRGTSNEFQAIWTLGGARIEAQMSIAIQGTHIEIQRWDTKSTVGLGSCIYSGDWNGTHWSGTNSCTLPEGTPVGPFTWSAVVR